MWILILFAHVGTLSDKDSMALASVPGFITVADCEAAGRRAESLASATTKKVRWVCVGQPK